MDSMLGHRMRFVSFLPEWHPAARPRHSAHTRRLVAPDRPARQWPGWYLEYRRDRPLTGDIASRLPVDQDPTTETTDAQPCN